MRYRRITITVALVALGSAPFAHARRHYAFKANVGVATGKAIPRAEIEANGDQIAEAALLPKPNCVPFDPERVVTLRYHFKRPRVLSGFTFRLLVGRGIERANHGRVAALLVTTDAGTAEVRMIDSASPVKSDGLARVQVGLPTDQSFYVLTPIQTSTLLVEVRRVHAGTKYSDVCISSFTAFEDQRRRPLTKGPAE